MNDADRKAYADAFWKYADENICREKDFEAGWQAACEWRDSQEAQTNQQLVEALEKITEVNEETPVKTYQEMERIAKTALEAAKEGNK